jgi:two-component system, OmpR family, sensor histidine kinase KdpD
VNEIALDESDRAAILTTILAESERLEHLVDNLLNLCRLQAGAAEPQRELWEVDELVVQALAEFRDARRRVVVAFPAESAKVLVDAVHVQRVLANLIENALKHSPRTSACAYRSRPPRPRRSCA